MLESLIKPGFAVVDKVAVGHGICGGHVHPVCRDGIAVLRQVVGFVIGCETVMLLVRVAVAHLGGVAKLIRIGKNANRVYESVVSRVFRIFIPEKVAACFAVDIVRALDDFVYVEGTAEMAQCSTPLSNCSTVMTQCSTVMSECSTDVSKCSTVVS